MRIGKKKEEKKFLNFEDSFNTDENNHFLLNGKEKKNNKEIDDFEEKENLELLDKKSNNFQVNLALLGEKKELEEAKNKTKVKVKEEKSKEKKEKDTEEEINRKDIEILEEARKNNPQKKKMDLTFILVIIAVIGGLGYFGGSVVSKIGFGICLFDLFISMLILNKKSAFGTMAFSLAFLFVIIYLISFVIVYTKPKEIVDATKSKMFRNDAITYLQEVKDDVKKNKTVRCNSRNVTTEKVLIPSLSKNITSPFGEVYNQEESYVLVEAKEVSETCEYRYFIYLTDNKYSLGANVTPILEDKVLKTEIRKVS